MSHLKTGGIYEYLNFRSFMNYTVDSNKEALKQQTSQITNVLMTLMVLTAISFIK